MAFDIRTSVFDGSGEYRESVAARFHDELLERFSESPEFAAITGEIGHVPVLLDYAATYCGVNLADISPDVLNELLFDIVPRKVSMSADQAPDMVAELRAFFTWLEREFGLPHAPACVELLDDSAADDLHAELSDESNFGMAKSFFMMGTKLGYDMSTQEGLDRFALVYNASLAGNRLPPIAPFFADKGLPYGFSVETSGPSRADRRKKRKQERKNRKKNRR